MKRIYAAFTILTLLGLSAASGFSQTRLDLEKCLQIAEKNNIGIQQTRNSLLINEQNLIQAKHDFFPNLNASVGLTQTFGTVVDQFALQNTQNALTSNAGISSNLMLFNGMQKWHTLHRREAELKANVYQLASLKNDLATNVLLFYFQVIFDQENLKIAGDRRDLVEKQLEIAEKKFKAGLLTQGDVMTIKARHSTEELTFLNQQNMLRRDRLNLIQTLNLDVTGEYTLMNPAVEIESIANDLPPIGSIFDYATENLPEMQQRQQEIIASEYSMKASNAGFMPSVSLNYYYGTFYSSNFTENGAIIGYDTLFGVAVPVYERLPIPFFNQYQTNAANRLSLSVSIPIYNNNLVRQGREISKINLENAKLNHENQKLAVEKKIQQAYLDAEAAILKFNATKEQLNSVNEAFKYSESKFEAGLIDFNTYLEALNNKTKAEADLVQAKYDYLLKIKILDLYQGKPLKF